MLSTVNTMDDHCSLCERPKESSSELCSFHNAALRNLEDAYASWSKAYDGKLSKEQYYAKLTDLPETGRTVKNVIEHLQGKGEDI